MRTMVFFDLPNIYSRDRRNYQLFRKFKVVNESVNKIMLNSQQTKLLIERIRKKAPKKGLIQVLTITEKQYSQIEYIIGSNNSKIIDSEDRLIVL